MLQYNPGGHYEDSLLAQGKFLAKQNVRTFQNAHVDREAQRFQARLHAILQSRRRDEDNVYTSSHARTPKPTTHATPHLYRSPMKPHRSTRAIARAADEYMNEQRRFQRQSHCAVPMSLGMNPPGYRTITSPYRVSTLSPTNVVPPCVRRSDFPCKQHATTESKSRARQSQLLQEVAESKDHNDDDDDEEEGTQRRAMLIAMCRGVAEDIEARKQTEKTRKLNVHTHAPIPQGLTNGHADVHRSPQHHPCPTGTEEDKEEVIEDVQHQVTRGHVKEQGVTSRASAKLLEEAEKVARAAGEAVNLAKAAEKAAKAAVQFAKSVHTHSFSSGTKMKHHCKLEDGILETTGNAVEQENELVVSEPGQVHQCQRHNNRYSPVKLKQEPKICQFQERNGLEYNQANREIYEGNQDVEKNLESEPKSCLQSPLHFTAF